MNLTSKCTGVMIFLLSFSLSVGKETNDVIVCWKIDEFGIFHVRTGRDNITEASMGPLVSNQNSSIEEDETECERKTDTEYEIRTSFDVEIEENRTMEDCKDIATNQTFKLNINSTVRNNDTCFVYNRSCPESENSSYVRVIFNLTMRNESNVRMESATGEFPRNYSVYCDLAYRITIPVHIELPKRDKEHGPNDPPTSGNYSHDLLYCSTTLPFVALILGLVVIYSYKRYKRKKLARRKKELKRSLEASRMKEQENKSYTLTTSLWYSAAFLYKILLPAEETSRVKIKDFENYVKTAMKNGCLASQYELLSAYAVWSVGDEYGTTSRQAPDQRYPVWLQTTGCIRGYDKEEAYLIVPDPQPGMLADFWELIWDRQIEVICMMENITENDKENPHRKYWPNVNKREEYGNITVLNEKTVVLSEYTIRTFLLTCNGEKQKVTHLHYTGWPKYGIPQDTCLIVEYLAKLLSIPPGRGPVVFHCCVDVGRVGVIILCDMCSRRAALEGEVDVFAAAGILFNSRPYILDNMQQYLLVHLILAQGLVGSRTKIICKEGFKQRIKEMKRSLPAQMRRLTETCWQDRALLPKVKPIELVPQDLEKNRFPDLAPVSFSSIYLQRYPPEDTYSDYISAVAVDGWRMRKQYVTSQLPLPTTMTSFWRMIIEYNMEIVVILQPPDLNDPSCCQIVPDDSSIPGLPHVLIKPKQCSNPSKYFKTEELLLTDTSKQPEVNYSVTLFTCKKWSPGKINGFHPPPPMSLMNLWHSSERRIRRAGPTLVLCHDGLTGCGLYVALCYLLERISIDKECDVIGTVRAIRRSRQAFIRTKEQLEYLYDAALLYVQKFEGYDNFV